MISIRCCLTVMMSCRFGTGHERIRECPPADERGTEGKRCGVSQIFGIIVPGTGCVKLPQTGDSTRGGYTRWRQIATPLVQIHFIGQPMIKGRTSHGVVSRFCRHFVTRPCLIRMASGGQSRHGACPLTKQDTPLPDAGPAGKGFAMGGSSPSPALR